MKIAILSDIHGNSWALEAVLEDINRRCPDLVINLGDSLYGPLQPMATFNLIKASDVISISGNEDRLIIEKSHQSPTLDYVINDLNQEGFDWLRSLPNTKVILSDIFLCHGTPKSDTTYLVEEVKDNCVAIRPTEDIENILIHLDQKIVLCGHSHLPQLVETSKKVIINPGSVGCPAFDDDKPMFHKIENFSHHANYCILYFINSRVIVNRISIPYDFQKAVDCAIKNNRPDWAHWIKYGRV